MAEPVEATAFVSLFCGRFDASTGSASATTAFCLQDISVAEPVEATTFR